MTRISVFSSPFFLGFDHFERVIDSVSKNPHEGYPPYNIEQLEDDRLCISIAVAGFERKSLQVTLEDNQLIVRGKQEDDPTRVYLHRGIATRQFKRVFVLAEGIEILRAQFEQGLLHIHLKKPQSHTRVEEIPIDTPSDMHQRESVHEALSPPRRRLVLTDETKS